MVADVGVSITKGNVKEGYLWTKEYYYSLIIIIRDNEYGRIYSDG